MNVIQVVTVVNNYVQYEHNIENNPFYKNFDLVHFDNTIENLVVPARYNYFIDNFLSPDGWVMFCHQDFFVNEDLSSKLSGLDRNCIYGVVGTKSYQCTGIILRLKGARAFTIRKKRFFENIEYGQHLQLFDGDKAKIKLKGKKVKKPFEVDTLDSCCLLMHSSLIRKHNLKFDEKFDFSLYQADLSIMVRKLYNIKTKVLQLNCCHLGMGLRNAGYFRCLARLIKKYPEEKIAVTFSGISEVDAFRYFFANKDFGQEMESFISMGGNL